MRSKQLVSSTIGYHKSGVILNPLVFPNWFKINLIDGVSQNLLYPLAKSYQRAPELLVVRFTIDFCISMNINLYRMPINSTYGIYEMDNDEGSFWWVYDHDLNWNPYDKQLLEEWKKIACSPFLAVGANKYQMETKALFVRLVDGGIKNMGDVLSQTGV